MRQEYNGREIALNAIPVLTEFLREHPSGRQQLAVLEAESSRISWETLCDLVRTAASLTPDLSGLGRDGVLNGLYKFRRRLRVARAFLTLEDAVRFILYPRDPIDFACVNVAVTSGPGRVDAVAYLFDRYEPCSEFYEIMLGTARAVCETFEPEGEVRMTVNGRQAHYVFTYPVDDRPLARLRRFVSRRVHALYSLLVIRQSYPYLVQGRKMFEEQLVARAKLEQELIASRVAFEKRLENVDDVIVEFDDAGHLRYASPNLERIIGRTPQGSIASPGQIVHTDDVERVLSEMEAARLSSAPRRVEDFRIVDGEGQTRWVEARWRTYSVGPKKERRICVVRDITERRRHREEREQVSRKLEQTQRLEMLGVLAGGVAHDFNNLLVPILTAAELASAELEDRPETQQLLEPISEASNKAAELVRQLMVYAGGKSGPFSSVDLGRETEEMLELIKTSVASKIDLAVELDDDVHVHGDVTQLRQVIMNLVINAAEAVGDEAGTVLLSIRRKADLVELRVVDDGCGMNDETLQRAFDPFYSTKFAGRGLGLAAVMGIVKAHGAELQIDSEPGEGTNVCVTFAAGVEELPLEEEEPGPSPSLGGTVLLVDDEPAVRTAGRRVLERLGYDVRVACDGPAALDLFEHQDFDLLILDLMMPRMDGREVLSEVRSRRPQQQVIMVSGYGAQLLDEKVGEDPFTTFLSKPYRLQAFKRAIEALPS